MREMQAAAGTADPVRLWLALCVYFPACSIMDAVLAGDSDPGLPGQSFSILMKVAVTIIKHAARDPDQPLHSLTDIADIIECIKARAQLPEAELHNLLTAAFALTWSPRQRAILTNVEGAETV